MASKTPEQENSKAILGHNVKRRSFMRGILGGSITAAMAGMGISPSAKAATWSSSFYPKEKYPDELEALIIGSGFGGAVSACRLGAKWPGKVMVVERGKRYRRNEFPRKVTELAQSFWNIPGDDAPRIINLGESHGVFDVRSYDHMDVITAAGYGGGSLLYAAALMEPVDPNYDANWPATIQYDQMKPYYGIVKDVLCAAETPRGPEPERALNDRYTTTQLIADGEGISKYTLPVGVFFGNDPSNPTPMGQDEYNKHGALQTSCTYCGECMVGCNVGAKTSLDYNYLYVAETKYNAIVRTEHMVDRIVALDAFGLESSVANGSRGYHVHMVDLVRKKTVVVKAKRVIVAAGSLGSTEILLRNKEAHGTLPFISSKLGHQFSGNGDFGNFVFLSDQPMEANLGPTIQEYLDYGASEGGPLGFVNEHLALPLGIVKDIIQVINPGPVAQELVDNLLNTLGDNFLFSASIGKDSSDGRMRLDWFTKGMRLSWPYQNNLSLYDRMIDSVSRVKGYLGAKVTLPIPTWVWPLRRNMTVHALGGCPIGTDISRGVVSAKKGELGRVFNYTGLYVADGSIVPSAIGSNPSITIASLAEMIAEEITGITPTTTL